MAAGTLSLPRGAASRLQTLKSLSTSRLWLVGGAIRDAALERESFDLDFAVAGETKALARALARRLRAKAIELDRDNGTFRVAGGKLAPFQMDFTPVQGSSIEEDLARRDFTLNALAWPLRSEPIRRRDCLDPFGGFRDLRKKTIRVVQAKNLDEDPLRALRAFRFEAELGFLSSPSTRKAISARKTRISEAAPERRHHEWMKIAGAPFAARTIRAMAKSGLLEELFPDLTPSKTCALDYYGKGGVLEHTLRVVERLEFLLARSKKLYPGLHDAIGKDLERSETPRASLVTAALLHDVSKPETAQIREGRLRFFDHDRLGAKRAEKILTDLRCSAKEVSFVEKAVRFHLRPGNLASTGFITPKAAFRFFQDLGDAATGTLLVCWADHASYVSPKQLPTLAKAAAVLPKPRTATIALNPPPKNPDGSRKPYRPKTNNREKTLHHLRVVTALLWSYFKNPARIRPKALLDGHAVMRALKIKPGPAVGRVLANLRLAQAEGEVRTKAQALRWIKTS